MLDEHLNNLGILEKGLLLAVPKAIQLTVTRHNHQVWTALELCVKVLRSVDQLNLRKLCEKVPLLLVDFHVRCITIWARLGQRQRVNWLPG